MRLHLAWNPGLPDTESHLLRAASQLALQPLSASPEAHPCLTFYDGPQSRAGHVWATAEGWGSVQGVGFASGSGSSEQGFEECPATGRRMWLQA